MKIGIWRLQIDEKTALHLAKVMLLLVTLLVFADLVFTLNLQSLSFEEGLSILFARRSLSSLLKTLVHEDLHPPLHYLLLHFWMMAAGKGEFAVRFISLFCAVLLPSLTFALAREIYASAKGLEERGLAVAVPAAALAGFSPFLTYYFQEARMYILVLTLTLAATLALLRTTRLGGRKEWFIYSLLLSLSFYTHYFALFVLPAFLLFACLKGLKYLKRWLGFTALALLAFSPWLRPAYLQMRRLIEYPDYWPGQLSLATILRVFVHKILPYTPQGLALGFVISIIVLALAMLIRNLFKKSNIVEGEILAVLSWVVPFASTCLLAGLMPKFVTRYFIISVVPFYLSAVIGLAHLLWRRPLLLRLLFVLILALAVSLSWRASLAVVSGERSPRDDVRSVARYLNEKAQPDDAILLVENAYHAFVYYYHGEAPWYGLHVGEDFEHGAKVL
ncbi:MAG: glycosyltransferase family 39 protein, partial [Chloroflexota bacterium]|nr:glycosyltransferase family 39 protein [Chloroflexota bacterium]